MAISLRPTRRVVEFYQAMPRIVIRHTRQYIEWILKQETWHNVVRRNIGHHWKDYEKFWRNEKNLLRATWNVHVLNIDNLPLFVSYVFYKHADERKFWSRKARKALAK